MQPDITSNYHGNEPATVWAAIAGACQTIKAAHPSATPEADYARYLADVGDDVSALAAHMPPMHVGCLAAAIRQGESK